MSLFDFLTQDPTQGQGFGPAPSFLAQDPTQGQGFGAATAPAAQPDAPMPVQQQPDLTPQQSPASGGLLNADAPDIQKQGLFAKLRQPDATGVSLLDKIGAAGAILRDGADPMDGAKVLQAKQQAFQKTQDTAAAQALKQKSSQAWRAAYQNGKFDVATYTAMMGDDFDPVQMGKVAKVVAPVGGTEGGYGYSKDPLTGQVTWQGERPPNYADATAAGSLDERARHDQATETQGQQHVGIAQANAALAAAREKRLASKPTGGGASWLPPGAKVIHLPGAN